MNRIKDPVITRLVRVVQVEIDIVDSSNRRTALIKRVGNNDRRRHAFDPSNYGKRKNGPVRSAEKWFACISRHASPVDVNGIEKFMDGLGSYLRNRDWSFHYERWRCP